MSFNTITSETAFTLRYRYLRVRAIGVLAFTSHVYYGVFRGVVVSALVHLLLRLGHGARIEVVLKTSPQSSYRNRPKGVTKMTYVSVVSVVGRLKIIPGRPRPQLSLFGHRWFEEVRVRRVRNPRRVRRVTAVSRTEIRIRHRHDDGAVLFAHWGDCVGIVRIGQMFLKTSGDIYYGPLLARYREQKCREGKSRATRKHSQSRDNARTKHISLPFALSLTSVLTSASSNVFKTSGLVSAAPVHLGLPFLWDSWWLPREARLMLNGDPGKLRLAWNR